MLAITSERVLAAQPDDEVEALVLDAREGACRIQPEWTEHRLDLALEVSLEPGGLLRSPGAAPEQGDPFLLHRRQQHLVQAAILLTHQAQGALVDRREQIRNRQGIRGELGRAHLVQLLQSRDADLEELIEVTRGDAQEPQPLEQRHGLIEPLHEHALVEFQERQLAVDVVLRGLEIRCVHRAASAGNPHLSMLCVTVR